MTSLAQRSPAELSQTKQKQHRSDARRSEASPILAQPTPAQPSQALLSPAQPSPAQPSAVQPKPAQESQKNIILGASSGYQIWFQNWPKFGPRTGPLIIFLISRPLLKIIGGPVLGPNLVPRTGPPEYVFLYIPGQKMFALGCAELCWVGLDWVGLGWAGQGWIGFAWAAQVVSSNCLRRRTGGQALDVVQCGRLSDGSLREKHKEL